MDRLRIAIALGLFSLLILFLSLFVLVSLIPFPK